MAFQYFDGDHSGFLDFNESKTVFSANLGPEAIPFDFGCDRAQLYVGNFAFSGTPAKTQIADLIHVLRFLRVDKIVGGPQLWKWLLKPGFAEDFEFLQHYVIRTMKLNVTAELTIPQQTP
jgi:hypothetical protein